MSVYVDWAMIPFGRMRMSHMVADSVEELHEFAKKLGLQREWFQEKKIWHYDICAAKRRLAVKCGAIEVESRSIVSIGRRATYLAKKAAKGIIIAPGDAALPRLGPFELPERRSA